MGEEDACGDWREWGELRSRVRRSANAKRLTHPLVLDTKVFLHTGISRLSAIMRLVRVALLPGKSNANWRDPSLCQDKISAGERR